MIGRRLNRFEIVEKIGEGGMGVVYRAVDGRLGRDVALKVLPESLTGDEDRLARFESEARLLASLNHPGIVAIYELGRACPGATAGADACHYLVMELVDGHSLKEEIVPGGVPLERFFALAVQLAGALAVAHRHGVVHRDLKPGNVMVTAAGGVKVLDFGLARRIEPAAAPLDEMSTVTMAAIAREPRLAGTVPYLSPEQIRGGPQDERVDVFAMAVILYELLTGRRPFRGDSAIDLMSSILRDDPPDPRTLRPGLPPGLSRVVLQGLEKEREARPASAAAMTEELEEARLGAGRAAPHAGDRSSPAELSGVAVLPFANLTGTEEAELLALGLHNDLITELSRTEGLKVISRASVMGYRGTAEPVREIAAELGVGTVIEGTVQSAGHRVRLTAQLIDVGGVTRWAERYDRDLSPEDLLVIQTELAGRIARSLQAELVGAATPEPSATFPSMDLDAYRLGARARVQLDRRTESGFRRAVEHFQEAVDRDPQYVAAWAGLADALLLTVDYGFGDRPALVARAEDAVRRALQLDADAAEAHAALGLLHLVGQNGPAMLRELDCAVRLRPGYAEAHNWLAWGHLVLGRAAAALDSARRSVELDPLSAEAVSNLAFSLLVTGRPDRTVEEARCAAELSPGWTTAPFLQALALVDLGRLDEAAALLDGVTVPWAGSGAEATLALVHVARGDRDAARRVLADLDRAGRAFAAGLVHAALGGTEAAFSCFGRVDRLAAWPSIAVHHLYRDVWDVLRDDPRFAALPRLADASWKLQPQEDTP